MGRIVISENVSLDGVIQDPTGEEGFRHGGWWFQGFSTLRPKADKPCSWCSIMPILR
jgi:hypothetical protein